MNEITEYGCFDPIIIMTVNQLHRHLEHGVKVIKYHSSDRPKDIEQIADSDIVLTTYSTLAAEFQITSRPPLLHGVDWFRVVLDEGKASPAPLPVHLAFLIVDSTYHSASGYIILSRMRRNIRQYKMVSHRNTYSKQARRHWYSFRIHTCRAFYQGGYVSEVHRGPF